MRTPGARTFLDEIADGDLGMLELGTRTQYNPKVKLWLEYNSLGRWDPLDAPDAKIKAFSGWLFSRSTDKALNGFTSAINDYIDTACGARPLNTHEVRKLKSRYHDKQLARTMQRLPPDALEPKEARWTLPPAGLNLMLVTARSAVGTVLFKIGVMLIVLALFCRPATVWGLQAGDFVLTAPVDGLRRAGQVWYAWREVKRHPEYRTQPVEDVMPVPPDTTHTRRQVYEVWRRCEQEDPLWYLLLARLGSKSDAAPTVTRWVRESFNGNIQVPPGRRLSSYSLRRVGPTASFHSGRCKSWATAKGHWTSEHQIDSYVERRFPYMSPQYAQLVDHGPAGVWVLQKPKRR